MYTRREMSIRTITSIAAIILIASCCMTGCKENNEGAADETYENIAFIGVDQSNQTNPTSTYSSESVSEIVYQTAYNYGKVCQISADGEPRVVIDAAFAEPDIHIDGQRKKLEAKNNRDVIIESLAVSKANTPECNILDALRMAAGRIHSDGGSGIVIIHNSGITTTGDLNFTASDLIHADPNYIVKELNERHAIPDLEGVKVIWYGMGSVAYPQDNLTTEYAYKLQEIWESILDKSGADYYINQTIYPKGEENKELPYVTTMPVISKNPIGENGGMSSIVTFDEETSPVNFHKETAAFIDEAAASKALEPVARHLLGDSANKVKLIGSTASNGSEKSCLELSKQRAKACAELLLAQGVNPNQIEIEGIGRGKNPLRVNDLDKDGNLIEEAAKHNRAVFVMFNQDSHV